MTMMTKDCLKTTSGNSKPGNQFEKFTGITVLVLVDICQHLSRGLGRSYMGDGRTTLPPLYLSVILQCRAPYLQFDAYSMLLT